MKYAWIENNTVRDIAPGTPSEFYTPDVAKLYDTQIDDSVERDATLVNGVWVNRQPVVDSVVDAVDVPRTWTADNIRAGLTLAEKVKWDNDSAPEIVTVKSELAFPKELAATTELLQLLVASNVITQASMDKVLQ